MFSIRNLIPKTLLIRFILIIILPILIGQILAVFLFYDRHWYNVSYYTSDMIANEIKSLVDNYDNFQIQKLIKKDDVNHYLNLTYKVYDHLKMPKSQPKLNEELDIFKNILNIKLKKTNIIQFDNDKKIIIFIALENNLLEITFPTKFLLNPTTYIFVLWLMFLTILLLSVSLVFSKNQIKSILELANAADAFGRGKKHSYKPSGAYEIRKTGLAFLKMKERIEKQVAKRTQMLAMISHDLRTPLTRMKLQLELMPVCEEIKDLKQDVDIMAEMITSYLSFAKGEMGEGFQILSITKWMINFIQSKYHDSDIELNIDSTKPLNLLIKPISFERAISNLINNAIKYSTKIKISIYDVETNILIEIEDNGSGISEEERRLVFKPFYRSNQSRTIEDSSNVGLGLAITKEIIEAHHGTITLDDSAAFGGLLVRIILSNERNEHKI